MTIKPELVKKVKYHFNLNIYESKVWLALLSRNMASVGEIAEVSGVPRSRVYDVLESLEKQGFAIAKLGKPVKYIAVKPAIVLERIKGRILKEAETRVKNLVGIRDSEDFRELENLYNDGIKPVNPGDLSAAIRGRANIYSHIKDLVSTAKKEVIMVSNPQELKRKAHFLKPIFEKLKQNNVKILIASSSNDREDGSLVNLSKLLGVPIKKIKVNGRFCIVDNEKAIITITPETEEDDIAILFNSPFFSKAMTSFLLPAFKLT
ncbi:MAG: helix-turn-helix domain-containing protein [Candidatus Pacearchaeota archaeon]